MNTQTWILDNKLYYTRKIELHRKGKKSRTVQITPILICPSGNKISVLITVRRVHYSEMGKVPTKGPKWSVAIHLITCLFGLELLSHKDLLLKHYGSPRTANR